MGERACVLIGSNIEPERRLCEAARELRALGAQAFSRVYQSASVGAHGPDYLNAAARLRTDLSADALRRRLREIESRLGRIRTPDRFAPRTIDLDLVAYGNRRVDPALWNEAYAAVPVAEVIPSLRHPDSREPIAQAARRLRRGAKLRLRSELRLDMV